MKRFAMTLALALALIALTSAAGQGAEGPDRLERALLKHAPQVIAFLKKYKPREGEPLLYVGVLKFAVQKGDGVPADNVGPLNLSLTHRLETALLLALTEEDRIGLLERPSVVVAAETKRGDHQWPTTRKALFDLKKFRLAWGTGEAAEHRSADVFLVGQAKLSADLRTLDATIRAFDRGNPTADPVDVVSFKAAADLRTLLETGESFLVGRDLLEKRKGQPASAADVEPFVESSGEISGKKRAHPGTVGNSPVTLEIRYGDEKKEVRATPDGRAEVDEPANKTRVTFRLHNTSKTDRHGVVLLVNGVNTLFEEQLPPEECHKWVLDPGEELTVRGFQETLKELKEFEVAPVDQAVKRFRYGDYVGTFQMIVFLEDKGPKAPAAEPSPEEEREQSVARAPAVKEKDDRPESLRARQEAVVKKAAKIAAGDKGLVVAGDKVRGDVEKVSFAFYRDPVMSSVIYYYRPRAK